MLSEKEEKEVTAYFRNLFFLFILFLPFIVLWIAAGFGIAVMFKK